MFSAPSHIAHGVNGNGAFVELGRFVGAQRTAAASVCPHYQAAGSAAVFFCIPGEPCASINVCCAVGGAAFLGNGDFSHECVVAVLVLQYSAA